MSDSISPMQIWRLPRQLWQFICYCCRYLRAKSFKKTLRVRVSDFQAFTKALERQEVDLVVLRWAEYVPVTPADVRVHNDDIDCLVDEIHIWTFIRTAARFPGTIKVDLYGVCGRRGTSYAGMPYYPPILAKELLRSKSRNARDFYVPNASLHCLSFAFHLVYHKGPQCGIPMDKNEQAATTSKDYVAELRRLDVDGRLPTEAFTLTDLHYLLKVAGWGMPLDLMVRWPPKNPLLSSLITLEKEKLADLATRFEDLVVFVIREDADVPGGRELMFEMISRKFKIVLEHSLDDHSAISLMRCTRGGNWIEKGHSEPTPPVEAWFCRPMKTEYTQVSKKLQRKYEHVENFDVLIKRDIRDTINQLGGGQRRRVVLHASDNAYETAQILKVLFDDSNLPEALTNE